MSQGFTKGMARNIFYGGALFFALVFAGIIFNTEHMLPARSNAAEITPAVVAGKKVWETHNCVGCHTILGEGAYYAPELGNVYARRGPDFIKAWIQGQPGHAENRRKMPQFNLTDVELDNLVEFLKWTNNVNTAKWPPNIEG